MKHYSDPSLEEKAVQEARRLIASTLLNEVKRHGEHTSLNAICDLVNRQDNYKTRIFRRIDPKDATPLLEEFLAQRLVEKALIYAATKDPPGQSYKAQLEHLDELKLVARTGTFLFDAAERSARKDAGYKAAQQRGEVIWSDHEKEYALTLSRQPEYQSPYGGKRRWQTNNIAVAQELNRTFHHNKPVRNPETVRVYLSKIRTALKSQHREAKSTALPRTWWSPEEKEHAYALSYQSEYQWNTRDGQKVHNAAIAAELNRRFHQGNEIRDRLAVGRLLSRYTPS